MRETSPIMVSRRYAVPENLAVRDGNRHLEVGTSLLVRAHQWSLSRQLTQLPQLSKEIEVFLNSPTTEILYLSDFFLKNIKIVTNISSPNPLIKDLYVV